VRFTTYTKYKGRWLDALNLESLMEQLSDFLLNGGFAGGPHFHPYWGWSGLEENDSVDALKRALLEALMKSGQLTPEMVNELRGEGQGDADVQRQIAELLDQLVQKMVEEGYITLEGGQPTLPGMTYDVTG
jgi:Ca-activated chloride channel family protein